MANIFDDDEGRFMVLINAEGQYSLWPAVVEVPAGWEVRLRDASRAQALAHVEEHWTDMRPNSLIAAMRS